MEGSKPWFMSRGVIGGLVAAGAGLAGVVGYTVGAPEQAQLAESLTALTTVGSAAVSAIGGLVAVIGRIRADKTIGR